MSMRDFRPVLAVLRAQLRNRLRLNLYARRA
jgi:hypothetical protein